MSSSGCTFCNTTVVAVFYSHCVDAADLELSRIVPPALKLTLQEVGQKADAVTRSYIF